MATRKSTETDIEVLGIVLGALKKLADSKQQSWVIASVLSNLGLTLTGAAQTGGTGAAVGNALTVIPGEPGSDAHARAFLRAKNPKSSMQQVACLAYYLTHHRQTPEFKTKDIRKMNKDAGGARLGNPSRDVANAYTMGGYLGTAGGGRKIITGFGEAIVDALPAQEAVKALQAESATRKRNRRKKSKKG